MAGLMKLERPPPAKTEQQQVLALTGNEC